VKPEKNPEPKRKCPFTKSDGHPKPDEFKFRCQILPVGADLSIKFNPAIFFIGQIFS
jgi:hypothetical protein